MNRSRLYLSPAILILGCVLQDSSAQAAKFQTIYSFCSQQGCPDGGLPYGGLLDVKGALYGTTSEGGAGIFYGTVFSVDPNSGTETVLYSFGSDSNDGQSPNAAVIELNGTLYGTTTQGGAYGFGTVFSFDPKTGTEVVLHSFDGYTDDGVNPESALVASNGVLYGTTSQGGTHGSGNVYSVDPKSGKEQVVYSFPGYNHDGYSVGGSLLNVKGLLYGAASSGGANRQGTVFSFDPKTGVEATIYSFCSQVNCSDGASPSGHMIDVNGTLFGTTISGGAFDEGTVYSLDPSTGAETVLYSFCAQQNCTDGSIPSPGLVEMKGTLYGTTGVGGSNGDGTAFSLDPKSGAETVLYSFDSLGNSGCLPETGLIRVKNKLYGTAYVGGAYGGGTVFELKP